MKRIRRLIFGLASAMSLLLCVTAAAMWVRSYYVIDGTAHAREGRVSGVYSTHGRVLLDTMGDSDVPRWPGFSGWHRVREPVRADAPSVDITQIKGRGLLGLRYARLTYAMGDGIVREMAAVTIPYWFLVTLFLLLPLAWLGGAARRRYRRRHQLCAACGYDLRSSPERCPECGAVNVQGGPVYHEHGQA
jgi:hypothetical protein